MCVETSKSLPTVNLMKSFSYQSKHSPPVERVKSVKHQDNVASFWLRHHVDVQFFFWVPRRRTGNEGMERHAAKTGSWSRGLDSGWEHVVPLRPRGQQLRPGPAWPSETPDTSRFNHLSCPVSAVHHSAGLHPGNFLPLLEGKSLRLEVLMAALWALFNPWPRPPTTRGAAAPLWASPGCLSSF